MESVGHSSLLKFLVSGRDIKMSEAASTNIESEVPGEQNIRGTNANSSGIEASNSSVKDESRNQHATNRENETVTDGNMSEIATTDDFTLDPVITVTKHETSFSKGDLKLQKVVVTEDISHTVTNDQESQENVVNRRLTYEMNTKIPRPNGETNGHRNDEKSEHPPLHTEKETMEFKRTRTRIPTSRFRQAIDKVKKERKERMGSDKEQDIPRSSNRKSSIPRLKGSKSPPPFYNKEINAITKEEDIPTSKADEEFDKIFQEMGQTEDTPSLESTSYKIENVNDVDSTFEEIMHAYEGNKVQPLSIDKVKQSKIPLLKRKSVHEIEVPQNRERATLKKSISIDTPISPTTHEENNTQVGEQTNVKSKETIRTYTQTKTTTERFVLQNLTSHTNHYKITRNYDTNTDNNVNNDEDTLVLAKTTAITNESDSQYQGSAKDNNVNNDEDTLVLAKTTAITNESDSQYQGSAKDNNVNNDEDTLVLAKTTAITNESDSHYQGSAKDNNVNNDEDTLVLAKTTAITNESDSHYQGSAKDNNVNNDEDTLVLAKTTAITNESDSHYQGSAKDKNVNNDEETLVLAKTTAITNESDSHYQGLAKDNNVNNDEDTLVLAKTTAITNESDSHYQGSAKDKTKESVKVAVPVFDLSATLDNNIANKIKQGTITTVNESIQNFAPETTELSESPKGHIILKTNDIEEPKKTYDIKPVETTLTSGHVKVNINEKETKTHNQNIGNHKIESERNEPNEPFPRSRIPKPEHKSSLGLRTNRQTSQELRKPVIVKEVLKDSTESRGAETIDQSTSIKSKCIEQEGNTNVKSSDSSSYKTLNNDILGNGITANATLERYNYKPVKDVVNNIEGAAKGYVASHALNSEVKRTETSIGKESDNSTLNNSQREIINSNTFDLKDNSQFDMTQANNNIKNVTDILNNDALKNVRNEFNSNLELDSTITTYTYETKKLSKKSGQKITKENTGYDFDFTPVGKVLNEILNEHSNTTVNILKEKGISFDAGVDLSSVNKDQSENKIAAQQYNEVITQKIKEINKMEHKKEEFIRREEGDIKRTTSVAELDLGNVIKGKVHEMIKRIKSIERIEHGKRQIIISETELPRKSSVSEKIALFEGKLSPARTEKTTDLPKKVYKTDVVNSQMDEDTYRKKIAELVNAKTNYVAIDTMYQELRDGSRMPVIALGTALLDKRLVKHVVEAAIDLGYRAFDTAYIYGNEREIGEAIKEKIEDGTVKRDDLFIISKLWSTFHRRDLVEKACRTSLQLMGLAYFDLFLIHNPMSLKEGNDPIPKIANVLQFSEHDYMDAWYGIEDLINKGLVRRGGVSNFNSEQVHRVMEKGQLKPVVNQVECHPYLSQDRLAGFCDAYGIKLNCFGVLGSKGTPAEMKSVLSPVIDDPLILVMAAGLGITPAQLLVAYQLHQGRSVVVKCSSAAHLHESLAAQRVQLDTTHIIALNALNRNKRTFTFKG
ncbi:unnamed protein product [Parnassius apollo]|uniref:(apollo) hypothetical protein n=1 Tax=Parnassius apollo TaxID=110799 RepID=A0A8S3Y8B7_PARAO|nr:unnamed protein product [Parnassius apollo]